MTSVDSQLVELEKKFWQSMVDNDSETAVSLLKEPALMVSSHGAMQFDHDGYRRMADQGPTVLKSYKLDDVRVFHPNDDTAVLTYRVTQAVGPRDRGEGKTEEMNDTSTWVRVDGEWKCVMHTETPAQAARPN